MPKKKIKQKLWLHTVRVQWNIDRLKGAVSRGSTRGTVHCSCTGISDISLLKVIFSLFRLSKRIFWFNKYLHFLTAFLNLPNQTWKRRPSFQVSPSWYCPFNWQLMNIIPTRCMLLKYNIPYKHYIMAYFVPFTESFPYPVYSNS